MLKRIGSGWYFSYCVSPLKTAGQRLRNCAVGLAILFLSMTANTQVAAQVWLPAPPAIECSTIFGTQPRASRAVPNPIVVGQPYIMEIFVGGPIIEYYFEVIGNELRHYVRVGPSPDQLVNLYCYKFESPPILTRADISLFTTYFYGQISANPPRYGDFPGIGSRPLNVQAPSQPVPGVGLIVIGLMGLCVCALVRRAFATAVAVVVFQMIAPMADSYLRQTRRVLKHRRLLRFHHCESVVVLRCWSGQTRVGSVRRRSRERSTMSAEILS
jgi:hypothetical protein